MKSTKKILLATLVIPFLILFSACVGAFVYLMSGSAIVSIPFTIAFFFWFLKDIDLNEDKVEPSSQKYNKPSSKPFSTAKDEVLAKKNEEILKRLLDTELKSKPVLKRQTKSLPSQPVDDNRVKKEKEQYRQLNKPQINQKIGQQLFQNLNQQESPDCDDISSKYKEDWLEIKRIVQQNNITKLYHFTDRANLQSIRERGGLFSWQDLENMNVKIPAQGGNDLSKQLDLNRCLQSYVRLSFVANPPMLYFAKKDGRILNPVILEIDPTVIFFKNTLYSDSNATSNKANTGGDLSSFKKIKFEILKQVRWDGEEEKHYWQAEIMVKNNIPITLIKNL